MQTTPPPRPPLPRRLLDDAWWLAAELAGRPARVLAFPPKDGRAAPEPPRPARAPR